jgi:hypothetical protein
MAQTYRITIEILNGSEWTKAEAARGATEPIWLKRREIVCNSEYTIASDLAEWVRVEIDPTARISTFAADDGCEHEGSDLTGE